jgi:hypothetical protein
MHRSLHNERYESGPSIPMHSLSATGTGSHLFSKPYRGEAKVTHRHAAPSAPWPWIDIHDRESISATLRPSLLNFGQLSIPSN